MTDKINVQRDPFELANYYTCDDAAEQLSCDDYEEAIAEVFDGCDPGDIEDEILRLCPVEVYAYARAKLPESWPLREAEELHNHLEERFADTEYPDPESGPEPLAPGDQALVMEALELAVRIYAQRVKIWHCERIGKRTFDAAAVREILKATRKEWFGE
jgi:hypothetical protein